MTDVSIVDHLEAMFPRLASLRIVNTLAKGSTVRIHAETTSAAARCRHCSALSRWVHSRHQRRVLDAALGGRETVLHLRARRFSAPRPRVPDGSSPRRSMD